MSKKLREADENKARLGEVSVNFQGHTNTRDLQDNAAKKYVSSRFSLSISSKGIKNTCNKNDISVVACGYIIPRFCSLFDSVEASLLRKPSYTRFIALADNFNRETGVAEPREKRETSNFLNNVLQSKPWKVLYDFLKQKGHPFANTPTIFRYWVEQLWFMHYSRARGRPDTSGFEHVFMGEEKNNEISGLHSWIRFYMLEKNATENFDYKGFIIKRGKVMASVKFTWKGDLKRSGSLLIGTSPEFDLALYTLCFLSRRGRQQCQVEIDGCPLYITSYELRQNNKVFIGSIFPTAGPLTEQCRRNG
ncbi:unnamed protein product [Angiostrongylus costaricensis]|uniref:Endoribonuclease n=1 Tax=Angiostrongylus costaricensis TaxID=334426 RepID=A0A0R3PUC5_ANGCS|nr:unnamed protein product [Angiostrongylus costaricensis]